MGLFTSCRDQRTRPRVRPEPRLQGTTSVRRTHWGLLLVSPCDVMIRKLPKLRVRQPDRVFFSNMRAGFDTQADLDRVQKAKREDTLAPDLVIEVLSSGQNERDLAVKLDDYASIQVEENWFADQKTKMAREGSEYGLAGEYRIGDRVISAVLAEIDVDVAALFS